MDELISPPPVPPYNIPWLQDVLCLYYVSQRLIKYEQIKYQQQQQFMSIGKIEKVQKTF